MSAKDRTKGIIVSIVSSALFGIGGTLGKMTYGEGSNPTAQAFYRAAISAAFLLIVLLVRRTSIKIDKKYFGKIAILGTFGQTVTALLYATAYAYIPAGTASTLHFVYPAIVCFISVIFFKEKMTIAKGIVLVMILGGMLFFFEGLDRSGTMGVILAISSGATWAFYILYMQRSGLSDLNGLTVSFYMSALLALECLIIGLVSGEMTANLTAAGWMYAILSGTMYGISLMTLQTGVKLAGPTVASVLGVFEPIAGIVAGIVLLGEVLTLNKLLGSVIVLGAIVLLIISTRPKPGEENAVSLH